MSALFKRKLAVTIARPPLNSFFGDLLPNAIVVRDLRVKFSIEKSLGEDPNTATLEIFNLSDTTLAELQYKPLHVRLDAGHGEEISRLFTGDLVSAFTRRDDSTTWRTTITLGDGARAYEHASVSRSYAAGVSAQGAVADIAKSMGLTIPTNVKDAKELASQFVSGISLSGPSRAQMTKVLNARGFKWSMQDGELQILRENETRANEAILIAGKRIVESPELGPPKNPGESPSLALKVLLYPDLTPGHRIKVESAKVNGFFRIERVKHTGDTRGPEWYSEVEGKML